MVRAGRQVESATKLLSSEAITVSFGFRRWFVVVIWGQFSGRLGLLSTALLPSVVCELRPDLRAASRKWRISLSARSRVATTISISSEFFLPAIPRDAVPAA